ncbi:MAG: amidohydrolase family protein [Bacteroidota bacterium]
MKKIKQLLLGMICLGIASALSGQETFPINDVQDTRAGAKAFINATIVVDENTTIDNGTLLIKDGKIIAVGNKVSVPDGYATVDLTGKYLYPSLIDLQTSYGMPEVKWPMGSPWRGKEQIQSKTEGAYNANEAIKAHFKAGSVFKMDKKAATAMRKLGFGTVLTFRPDGLTRGTGAVVTLGETNENKVMLHHEASAHYSFNKGSSKQMYPVSRMGQIALLKQTYLDAKWFGSQTIRPFADQSLEAFLATQQLPQFFEAGSWMDVLRADKMGDELGIQYIITGHTDAYQRIEEIKATQATLIVPVNFPEGHDVEDPFDAERVTYKDMLHWELAPTNPAVLTKNGVNFALTTHGLKKKTDFLKNIRKAIKNGLSEKVALAALTTRPAELLGMSNQIGALKKGNLANFIVTDGPLFAEKTILHENWIQGHPYRMSPLTTKDFSGKYALKVGDESYDLEISGTSKSPKAKIIVDDSTNISVKTKLTDDVLTLSFAPDKETSGKVRLSGWVGEDSWQGQGQLVDGTWVDWSATPNGSLEDKVDKKKDKKEKTMPELGEVVFPFVAFGTKELPSANNYLIKNATVWTNEADGVLENTDVLITDGKIAQIGKNLKARKAVEVDGTGKHLTAGIIDEHTHIATSAVNDVATNSSMVRIGDVVDSEDADIYRALAGGVTAAQVLHGSANPIGGQSALIKMRWGMNPEAMQIKGADGFIKFALGENVKRSRSPESIRFPQTRMGVEQVLVDAFTNALEYDKKWKTYLKLSEKEKAKAVAPRRDLVHETILEIINKERFISCHSYVQSEINMLMHVANQFGFTVNTFTHILEGYKVADKMAKHGAGGSTFSDWWNYKWEVRYAIPYNATIMHREGVVTAINSDDNNIGRRLNQEAAKSIKYGGMSEEDALKMVTLNPAKLLHLDDRMGSIKVGKDGDVVLWTDNPLSVYAKAEKTFVDGKIFFDLEDDKARRVTLQKERARLIQKLNAAKKGGSPMKKGGSKMKMEMHCNSILGSEDQHEH